MSTFLAVGLKHIGIHLSFTTVSVPVTVHTTQTSYGCMVPASACRCTRSGIFTSRTFRRAVYQYYNLPFSLGLWNSSLSMAPAGWSCCTTVLSSAWQFPCLSDLMAVEHPPSSSRQIKKNRGNILYNNPNPFRSQYYRVIAVCFFFIIYSLVSWWNLLQKKHFSCHWQY